VASKSVQNRKDCLDKCKFNCAKNISVEERQKIFEDFYQLNQNGKYHYYGTTTKMVDKIRSKSEISRKKYTFRYFLYVGSNKIRVCKDYYLGTLSISQKPIYNFHNNKKDAVTGILTADCRGKHPKRKISEESKNRVRRHIESFPTVESHYTRASSKRLYLESQLNIEKLYDLYVACCNKDGEIPVKSSYYRNIFVTEYNLDFHVPKSDRCDLCEEHKVMRQNKGCDASLSEKYDIHLREKTAMREARNSDRQLNDALIVSFDLENVITLPKAGTSNFFYKRKLNLYNLTAHASLSGRGYCAIWPETLSGRDGSDIASALIRILGAVVTDHPHVSHIIT